MDLKRPLSYDEQLNFLSSHGVEIADREYAKKVLQNVNYYRLSGYALQFREEPTGNSYLSGTTFSNVYQLYKFDEALRWVFRLYLEKVEVYYKTQIAYGFSINKCTIPPYDQHYYEGNFYNKIGYKEVMDNFNREKNYYKETEVYKHHNKKYSSKMPLWVILEFMTFSSMSKLYNSMYVSEKEYIVKSVGAKMNILSNHLHCLSVFRNKCSHAVRIYNTEFNPPAKFSTNFLKKYQEVKNNTLFAYVLVLLQRLPDETSKNALVDELKNVINQYKDEIDMSLIGFPENYINIIEDNFLVAR